MLDFWNKGLWGTLPAELGEQAALTHLWLNRNRIGGVLPSEISNCPSMAYLRLDGNHFQGAIPLEARQCKQRSDDI